MRFSLPSALLALVLAVGCAAPARAGDAGGPPDQVFAKSLALFQGKSYAAGRDGFKAYREAVGEAEPNAPKVVEAIYYEAECRYFDDDKYGAHELYRKILDAHRNFPRLAEVINREYEIGSAFIEGKAKKPFLIFSIHSESLGAEILQYLIERYQQKYFDFAQYQVADFYFRGHDWRRAADAYLSLEENFKESPWAGVAKYQRALCYLGLSRGYRYDPTSVLKAEEVLLDYVKRNPTGSRIREAEKALEEIRAGRCQLYVENAEFYLHREKRPRAALVYVEAILRETPEAPAAREVPGLLRRIAEKAAESDPATATLAKEMLADLDRRGAKPAPAGLTPVAPAATPAAKLQPPGPIKPTSGRGK